MNLWVKRVRQLAVVAVALFFFSCEDETSLLGYKNPSSKFKLGYVDIPVGSSVLLFDSIRSSNFDASNDLNRWLVGKYIDPKFGEITSTVFTEFLPLDTLKVDTIKVNGVVIRDTPIFDYVALQIRHDFYVYGTEGNALQEIGIHELTEKLSPNYTLTTNTNVGGQNKPQTVNYSSPKNYYTKSVTSFDPVELGSKQFNVNFRILNGEIVYDSKDTLQHIPLDPAFGQRLFDLARNNPDSFKLRSFFTKYFKGLALETKQADKILGFMPTHDSTRLELRYHTSKGAFTLAFSFNNLVNYNKITADRSSSELSILNNFYEDTDPADGQRYIQAGTGVVTKLDFSKFIEFAHSDTITRMAINSAELVIKNLDAPGQYIPPQNLIVKILKDNNRVKKLAFPSHSSTYQKDFENIRLYEGKINFDQIGISNFYRTPFDSTFTIMDDLSNFFVLGYSSSENRYKGTASLFFQQLFLRKDDETLFTKVVLMPYETSSSTYSTGRHINGKTLNRVTFNKDNIVLRVYYTLPTVNQNQ